MDNRYSELKKHGTLRRTRGIAAIFIATLTALTTMAQDTKGAPSAFLLALHPLRSKPPLVAVLASNEGTETTDFIVPYAVLKRAEIATIVTVAPQAGLAKLMPALNAAVIDRDFASFDQTYPHGADIVVVPAMHSDADPRILKWLQTQAAHGAVIVAICSGARVLAQAGLLDQRTFTGHWWDRDYLLKLAKGSVYLADIRYAVDGRIITTTGVSASVPVSLALVEGIAGAEKAREIAKQIGLESWGTEHHSGRFGLNAKVLWSVAIDVLAFWSHETIGIPIYTGDDDVRLALVADAWSRSFRANSFTVGNSRSPVRLRSGLQIIPTYARGLEPEGPTIPINTGTPMEQLTQTMCDIGERYGSSTQVWVELLMEYDFVSKHMCSVHRP